MKSIIPLLCIILAGCSSMSVFQSPGVLPKDKTETGIGASFIGDEDELYPVNLEIHSRRGLGENWEAGANFSC